jgi:hypothetical protein
MDAARTRSFAQFHLSEDFFVFKVCGQLQGVCKINAWHEAHPQRLHFEWSTAAPLCHEASTNGIVQSDLE